VPLGLGPALRTLRRHPGVLALVVLEIAAGITTIDALLIAGAWYRQIGARPSGLDETNLVLVSTYTARDLGPGAQQGESEGESGEAAVRTRQEADHALAAALPDVEGVARITGTIIEDRWSFPSAFTGRVVPGASPGGEAVGWAYHADANLPSIAGLRFLAGGAAPAALAGGVGRGLAPGGPVAAILTECLARRLFVEPTRAVGGLLSFELAHDVPVVGVVHDVTMKVPFMPHSGCVAFLFGATITDHEARLLVRARPGRREAVLSALRAAFAPTTGPPSGHAVELRPFDSTLGLHHRIGTGVVRMFNVFGVLVGSVALLASLAATSFLVAQRRRQIGVRRALGATRGDIVRDFLVESALSALMGSLLGLVFTAGLYALMVRIFQGIVFPYALVALAIGVVWMASIVATLVPALGAARVPPSVASRSL